MSEYYDSQNYDCDEDAAIAVSIGNHPDGSQRSVSKGGQFPGRAYWYIKDDDGKFTYFRWEDPNVQAQADAEYQGRKGITARSESPKKHLNSFEDLAQKVETSKSQRGGRSGRGRGGGSRKGGRNVQTPYTSAAKIPTMKINDPRSKTESMAQAKLPSIIEFDDLLRKRLQEQTEQIKKFIVSYCDANFRKLSEDIEADGAAIDDHFGWLYDKLGKDMTTQEDKDFILEEEDLETAPTDEDLSDLEFFSRKRVAKKPSKKRTAKPKEKKENKKRKVNPTSNASENSIPTLVSPPEQKQ